MARKLIVDEKERQLIEYYQQGMKLALISTLLEVSERTVKETVSRLIAAKVLRTRRPNLEGKILFRLQLEPDDQRKIYEGAKRRGSTKADYVRYLIRRDNP